MVLKLNGDRNAFKVLAAKKARWAWLAMALALALTAVGYLNDDAAEQVVLRAQGVGPVLPLAMSAAGDAPFSYTLTRDQALMAKLPQDDADAARIAGEVKEARQDLARSKGERAAELNEQAYEGAVTLGYYFEDVAAGRVANADRAKAQANLGTVRTMAAQHAAAVLKISKDEAQKAKAQFHLNALAYAAGSRANAAQGMEKLAKSRLSAALKTRAALTVAVFQIDSGRDTKKGSATVAALAPKLSGNAQVGARLIAARAAAGLNRNGQHIAKANAAYRNSLAAASAKAAGMNDADKHAMFKFIVGVWRAAEPNAAWDQVPFKTGPFKDMIETKALVERSALADWSKGNRALAAKKYKNLAREMTGHAEKAALDMRALDFARADYAQSKQPRPYEAAIIADEKVYLDPGVLGEGQDAQVKNVRAELSRRHEALVMGEMARVSAPNAAPRERITAIAMASTFIASVDDAQKVEPVKEKVGSLYAMNKQHREAVQVYRDLAETTKGPKAPKYSQLAIASQTILANWTAEAPWNGFKKGPVQEREELIALYGKLGGADGKKNDWFILAQQGLLQMSLGQQDQAFQMWSGALKADAAGAHAANAAGTMLVAYQGGQNWAELESLARLCNKQRMQPVAKGVKVDGVAMLAMALLEGGKAAMEDGKFAVAVAKLKEFVKDHAAAKNYDEGFYLLGSAYHGSNQHKDSITTLVAFVERFQQSKYFRQALLNGGDWSAPMAFEENTISFYQRFVTQFNHDGEATRVRDSLTALYLGRQLYSEAVAVLEMTVKAPNLGAERKSEALVQIMGIEERQGSETRAEKSADMLIAASDATDAAKGEAFSLKARHAAKKSDVQTLRALEGRLMAMTNGGTGSTEVQEALGETRYYLAAAADHMVVQKYFNLALLNPSETLEKRFSAYGQARTAYKLVCESGQTSFCAPAMHRLARLSDEFSRSLEDIEIQATLAKEIVQHFKARKQAIFNEMARTSQTSDDKAVAIVKQGYTDPDWTQAVLWQNSSDWNFERVSGEAGNGYVQFLAPAAQ